VVVVIMLVVIAIMVMWLVVIFMTVKMPEPGCSVNLYWHYKNRIKSYRVCIFTHLKCFSYIFIIKIGSYLSLLKNTAINFPIINKHWQQKALLKQYK